MKRLLILFAVCCMFGANGAELTQNVHLYPGWNAFYLKVAPTDGNVDEFFAALPTDFIGVYDAAKFLSTRQFSAKWTDSGLATGDMLMWRRGRADASGVKGLSPNLVCVCFVTNAPFAGVETELRGVANAPRTTWHVSSTNTAYNFVGVTIADGKGKVTVADYFDGFDGNPKQEFYCLSGEDANEYPTPISLRVDESVRDGDVLLVPSAKISNWSGVLNVDPMDGADFGTEADMRTISVRNDGTKSRTVSVAFNNGILVDDEVAFDRNWLLWRDAGAALTNATWHTNIVHTALREPFARKLLKAGETWSLDIALDRAAMPVGHPKGTPTGAYFSFLDEDGGSAMCVNVPVKAAFDGLDGVARDFKHGLWVVNAAFDTVSALGNKNAAGSMIKSGGTFKVRLLLHIDEHDKVRLLQRVVVAGKVRDNKFEYELFAGNSIPDADMTTTMRLSSVVLPAETPVIEAAEDSDIVQGRLHFAYRIEAAGSTSLLRHPLHPRLDGKDWDGKPAPSGDDYNNYLLKVKPETFSTENEITLNVDFSKINRWDRQSELTGKINWIIRGLRHEGPLKATGLMSLRRVSDVEVVR